MSTFIDKLIQKESSGRTDASYTDRKGRTFRGLGQLGVPRLREVGLGRDFTMEDYETSEDIQRMALERDIANTRKFIEDNNIAQYYGQEIKGSTFDEPAAIAVAHLGGREGLRRFVTDANYNPQDELGTSLSDYSMTFSGQSTGQQVASNEERPLARVAADNKRRVETSETIALHLLGRQQIQDNPNNAAPQPQFNPVANPQPGTYSFGNVAPYGSTTDQKSRMFGLPQLGNPVGMSAPTPPGAGIPAIGYSGPGPLPPSDSAYEPVMSGGQSNVTGVAPEQQKEQEEPNFIDRLSGKLFPKAENPKQRLSETLMALSTSLGQMSAGAPVNLAPLMESIQMRRQAVLDNAAMAYEDQMKSELKLRRLDLDNRRLAHDEAKFNAGQLAESSPVSSEALQSVLTRFPNDPQVSDMVTAISTSTDPTLTRQLTGELFDYTKEAGQRQAAQLMAQNNPTIHSAYEALENGDTAGAAQLLDRSGMDPQQIPGVLSNLQELIGRDVEEENPPSDMMRYVAAAKEAAESQGSAFTPEDKAEAIREYRRLDQPDTVAAERLKTRRLSFNNYLESAAGELGNLSTIDHHLRQFEGATIRAESSENNRTSGMFDRAVTRVGAAIKGTLNPGEAQKFEDMFGYNFDALAERNAAAAALALAVARPLLAGQGTVTDGERRALAESIVNTSTMSPAQALEFAAQMRALNAIDRMATETTVSQARENLDDPNGPSVQELDYDNTVAASKLKPQITSHYAATSRLNNINLVSTGLQAFPSLGGVSTAEYIDTYGVTLSSGEFKDVRDHLDGIHTPENRSGSASGPRVVLYRRINDDDSYSYVQATYDGFEWSEREMDTKKAESSPILPLTSLSNEVLEALYENNLISEHAFNEALIGR